MGFDGKGHWWFVAEISDSDGDGGGETVKSGEGRRE